jgi:hypothetical protein
MLTGVNGDELRTPSTKNWSLIGRELTGAQVPLPQPSEGNELAKAANGYAKTTAAEKTNAKLRGTLVTGVPNNLRDYIRPADEPDLAPQNVNDIILLGCLLPLST